MVKVDGGRAVVRGKRAESEGGEGGRYKRALGVQIETFTRSAILG